MKSQTVGELRIDVAPGEDGRVEVVLQGKSSARDAGRDLQPALDRILSAARAGRGGLTLHFERLEYFNSSTIAALIQFLRRAQREEVPVLVRYDARLKWQAISFEALARALEPPEPQGAPAVRFVDASAR